MRFSGWAMPYSAEQFHGALGAACWSGRARVAAPPISPPPIRYSGSRLVSGSWKIMLIGFPDVAIVLAADRRLLEAGEMDHAASDTAGRIDQADDREPGDGFSGAGLPTTPSTSPWDVEPDPVIARSVRAAGDELHLKVTHGENWIGHAIGFRELERYPSSELRIERVAQPIAEQIDGKDQRRQRKAGRRRSTTRRRTGNCCRSGSGCRARAWCRACRRPETTTSPR